MLNSFSICPDLFLLIPLVGSFQGTVEVTSGHWVKNADVHIGFLSSHPEPAGTDVNPSLIGGVGSPVAQVFAMQRKEHWFCGDIVTHLPEHAGCQVPDFIMSDADKSTPFAHHGVVDVIWCSANTGVGKSLHRPAIPESNSIDKFLFVEAEAFRSEWKRR